MPDIIAFQLMSASVEKTLFKAAKQIEQKLVAFMTNLLEKFWETSDSFNFNAKSLQQESFDRTLGSFWNTRTFETSEWTNLIF